MLRHSFIMLDQIGVQREQQLYREGITDWNAFLRASRVGGISNERKVLHNQSIRQFSQALGQGEAKFFYQLLPCSQAWRLYECFANKAVYLDIETTGLANSDKVTVVGLFDGYDTKLMVDGINLDWRHLALELQQYEMVVTFNGASFDIPFIERRHPGTIPSIPHFDVRHACSLLGYCGGLKAIEKSMGIVRPVEISELRGGDAVTLWRMYKGSGDEHYLQLLLKYNEEDITNLQTLARLVVSQLKHNHLHKVIPCDCSPKLYKATSDSFIHATEEE